jgi:histidinol dehydrogenase
MTGILRFRGSWAELPVADRRVLLDRELPDSTTVRAAVAEIVAQVRARGDAAVRELTARFDQVNLTALEVPRPRWRVALGRLEPRVRAALERAARNIDRAHRAWAPRSTTVETEPGVILERRPVPLRRVGVYAPGGRAVYPSSVLMGVVPAKAAGVPEVVVCSPPGKDGLPAAMILAAAELAGADRVFAIGGAQAIAALGFGTDSVPPVERIIGPGNAYVTEAKILISDRVAIDSPAGPTEVVIIADAETSAELVAGELVAQAEHDPRAVAVAIAIGAAAAERIEAAVPGAVAAVGSPVAAAALGSLGAVLSVETLDQAVELANQFAPEHLVLAFPGAERVADRFTVAGTVFVGGPSSVAFGDYLTGANHVLPTAGLARSYSGLGPEAFTRWTTYQTVSADAACRLSADTATLAEAEGLPAHARAARYWESQ